MSRDESDDAPTFRRKTPPPGSPYRDADACACCDDVSRELEKLTRSVVKHDRRLVAGFGEEGDNGKHGELRRQVDGVNRWLRWAVMSAAGALLTSAVLVFKSGLQLGAAQQQIDTLVEKVRDIEHPSRWNYSNHDHPALPDKEPTP